MEGIWVLFLGPLLAGIAVDFSSRDKAPNLKPAFMFGGAYILALTLTHILPGILRRFDNIAIVLGLILAGLLFQFLIDKVTRGAEHGEVSGVKKVSVFTLLFGLCLHSFLEGALLGGMSSDGHGSHDSLLIGILLHKLPAAFALAMVVRNRYEMRWLRYLIVLIFALTAPIGMYLSHDLSASGQEVRFLDGLMAFVTGNLLFVLVELFKSLNFRRWRSVENGMLLLGLAIGLLSEII
ncbi:hypothetical protein FUAX_05900 [Fulvitalea axinellae]|uniref:ZIP family metal transporter n=1 Tax=Fulvitalea axinellae TaxID=1182444 RepID=A0AAU9CEC1_9BACT|nr:hypothetical protein FUAX_05900 [Fulvitalea axinellae]